MQDLKYKIRASRSLDLVASCATKVRNKLEWDFKPEKDYSDALIKIAVEVYNKQKFGYEPAQIITFDLDNGKKREPEAVQYYDQAFGTNYYELYSTDRQRKTNKFSTGERDFGDNVKTIDCKVSTCKNVFDTKKFTDLETKYVAQLNTYKILYNTPKLELYNFLAPKSFLEIEQMVYNERKYNFDHDDAYYDELQEKYEKMYGYDVFDGYGIEERTQRREVPIIENWEETLYLAAEKMNRFITEKLEK